MKITPRTRSGDAYVIVVVFFVLIVGVGILWVVVQKIATSAQASFTNTYPYGVYPSNNVYMFDFILNYGPFLILMSLFLFVIVAMQRQKRYEPYYG